MTSSSKRRLGNYQLSKLIGEGTFTEAYLGEHIQNHTEVAIKVLDISLTKREAERFLEQVQKIIHLKHSYILRLRDADVEGRTPYLVMNYASHGTLRNRCPKGTRLPLEETIHYAKQIAEALQYIHENSLVHQDVKPESIFLGDNGEILLGDFSLSLIAHSVRYSNIIKEMSSTLIYMAPEELEGKALPASDQYSLGLIVYEWLSGICPFSGFETAAARKRILASLIPLHEKFPEIPLTVEQVILKALAQEPLQRFETVQNFTTALEKAYIVPQPSSAENNNALVTMPTLLITQTEPLGRKIVPKKIISRRKVIVGFRNVFGVVAVGSGVALIWFVSAQSQPVTNPLQTVFSTATRTFLEIKNALYIYRGHSDVVFSVAWSPNGRRIASAGYDKTVQVWNVEEGKY